MILAIDVGTSSLKAVLYDGDGHIAGTSARRYSYQSAQSGWAEADPEDWWQALGQALADLSGQGLALGQVEALSFTGQMHTAVLLDSTGRVIPPTILWLDRRASQETEDLQRELRLPPHQLNSTYTLPKLLWLHRHQPAVLAQVDKILWPKDYLRFRLTGEVCTDLTEPGGSALLDWDSRTWATERLAMVGLGAGVLPPIRPAHASGGSIRPEAFQALGLNPRAHVVVGMGDVAALFGAAPPRPGRAICSLGSSSMVFVPLREDQRVKDPSDRVYVYPFGPYPMLGGVSSTTGSSLVWACEKLGKGFGQARPALLPQCGTGGLAPTGEPGLFDACVAEALQVEPGAAGLVFLPYLAGERSPHWSDEIRGGFYGLQLTHAGRHLVRAVMEGVAYSMRHLLDLCAEAGAPVDEIALAGGGTATPGWPQIFADVCQREVRIYAEAETVTRVLYALCQQHLGRGGFADRLLQTFADIPPCLRSTASLAVSTCATGAGTGGTGQAFGHEDRTQVHPNRAVQDIYQGGYQRYRAFAEFARQQAGL